LIYKGFSFCILWNETLGDPAVDIWESCGTLVVVVLNQVKHPFQSADKPKQFQNKPKQFLKKYRKNPSVCYWIVD